MEADNPLTHRGQRAQIQLLVNQLITQNSDATVSFCEWLWELSTPEGHWGGSYRAPGLHATGAASYLPPALIPSHGETAVECVFLSSIMRPRAMREQSTEGS